MDPLLAQLSTTVAQAKTLETLTRPLLELLAAVTGLESSYLTAIDLEAGEQQVRYALNQGRLQIPEGLRVPWNDTLCKRALDENRFSTDAVAEHWGDSDAARVLGIQTYMSMPILGSEGQLMGTLCAASDQPRPIQADAERLLALFSALLSSFIERELLVQRLQAVNARLSQIALVDPLTELPNRRALIDELGRLLARAQRERCSVLVGVVDLDGFKAINDTQGHAAGDQFLRELGRRLAAGLRATDMLGRLGGDEFLILGPGPQLQAAGGGALIASGDALAAAQELEQRHAQATRGSYQLNERPLVYGGASVGVVALDPRGLQVDQAIQLADARMYEVKRARQAETGQG